MGQMTLDRFRKNILASPALQSAQGIDNDLVTDWVNAGYFEVAGAIVFEPLIRCANLTTVSGTGEYKLPARFLAMMSIQDQTSGSKLNKTTLRNLHRFDSSTQGYPQYWARTEAGVELWPAPDGAYALHAFYLAEPLRLEAKTDTTVLPATYDKAILTLALASALELFGQFDAVDKLVQRATMYLGSRFKEDDVDDPGEAPLNIVTSLQDMQNVRPFSGRYL